jgi:hypothetical protein
MGKCGILSVWYACMPLSLFAVELGFTMESGLGMVYGKTGEIVYQSDKLLSRLEWEEQYAGERALPTQSASMKTGQVTGCPGRRRAAKAHSRPAAQVVKGVG